MLAGAPEGKALSNKAMVAMTPPSIPCAALNELMPRQPRDLRAVWSDSQKGTQPERSLLRVFPFHKLSV